MSKDEKKPVKVLFVCLGNICRSPAAEGVMRQLIEDRGLQGQIEVDSAGLGNWHVGDLPDRRMRSHAAMRGINLTHRARQVRPSDFRDFDLIIGMDDENVRALRRMAPTPEDRAKVKLITDYSTIRPRPATVPDPYYGDSRAFDYALDLIEDACSSLLPTLLPH
ncbi:MAG: low molecular weight phosphotyrosine protein phosphatase [Bacteroidales bacterium]|nr:low molecular weight phosphotyrosine protein phosphatase [Bacteroidales bacterium]